MYHITFFYRGNTIYASNVGDSRAIASIGGVAKALSVDHKPGDEKERARIEKAGGFVEFNRVNGNLALSRALGDFGFKTKDDFPAEDQIVCCDPDIVVETIDESWEWVLLACDGIWDVLSNQEVSQGFGSRGYFRISDLLILFPVAGREFRQPKGGRGQGARDHLRGADDPLPRHRLHHGRAGLR